MDGIDSPALVDRADDGSYRWSESGASAQVSAPSWQAPASSAVAPAWQKPTSVADNWAAKSTLPAGSPVVGGGGEEGQSAQVSSASGAATSGKASSGGEDTSPTSGGGSSGGSAGSGAYKEYHGNGDNWPKKSAWVGSFDAM